MAIYDSNDTRVDLYAVIDSNILARAESVCLIISSDDLIDNGDGTFSPDSTQLGNRQDLLFGETATLCANQRFLSQPSAVESYGTGFLVPSTLQNGVIATAQHVLETVLKYDPLPNLRFVFGWRMRDAINDVRIPAAQIYTAHQVVAEGAGNTIGTDWALIEVTAPVVGRTPLVLSQQSPVLGGLLYCISHPSQLALKYSTGKIQEVPATDRFHGSVTAFGGSSGAPIFDATSGEVLGMYNYGSHDYEKQVNCLVACDYVSTDLGNNGRMLWVQQFAGSIP